MKIVTIVGARPQFIKASIVSQKLKEKGIEEIYIHTGQHYDENMSDIFFEELNIDKPKYNLHVGSGLHGEQTGKMIIEIEKVLLQEKPEGVLLYGDTNSTLAGAIATSKLHIPIFHVEGGERNHDKSIPEEINRILTDHVSEIIFTPTIEGIKELEREGLVQKGKNSGDVMLDRLLENIKDYCLTEKLEKYSLKEEEYYLMTLHRPTNTDKKERIFNILSIIDSLDKKIVFPIHPRSKNLLKKYEIDIRDFKNIIFVDPVSYNEMMTLVKYSSGVLTDSGGLQKEACFLGKKCITIFDHTPWRQLEKLGFIYVWRDLDRDTLIENLKIKRNTKECLELFGNGRASEKIVNDIYNYLIK
ncbi:MULTISPECIES: non-hydrolyzing UDP-N-acetylglucosamine 2-epimerase [Fusobacterium]|uniref:non-hydrolyzing UDP-N-acetylglucosamine 2-epimerase n=1 Tax=Fusobacterium TaxID=848 RepID=UPI001476FC34|nr:MULTISPECIES: UDP-N-acetylglucosamine 2-epimerase (non-hydrolyzing) [Fusobacterium]NME35805.1 UDP-N-acetylglucosamine 2-epimerase (non-hydrolyzing) [Fusobacterium sp. FSA-380-WT-3A]